LVIGSPWAEIDVLFLMRTKEPVKLACQQQGQVDKGAKAPVADDRVAFFQFGVHLGDLGHVMGAQGSRQHLNQEPGAGMKHGEYMGNGKTTAPPLASWLAKVLLQLGCVRHAEGRAIDIKGAMPMPARTGIRDGTQGRAYTLQQGLQHLKGQASTRVAVSSFAEVLVRKVEQPCNCEVAVEDLRDEEVNRGDRVEQSFSPSVANVMTRGDNLLGFEDLSKIALDAP
jgi:hypothetical protein